MRKLVQHIVVFAGVNVFIVAIWVLIAGGSPDKLQAVLERPGDSVSLGFWPIFVILGWGLLLVLHASFAVPNTIFGDRAQRRRQKLVHHAASGARDVAKDAIAAIDKAHERRTRRTSAEAATPAAPAAPAPSAPSAGRPSSGPARRWVTVMFCDVAGSTSHNERLGDDEWHRVLAHIRTVLR